MKPNKENEQRMTHERLKELLNYDRETGMFTRKTQEVGCPLKKGEIVGGKHNSGYYRITVDKKTYLAHRLAWFYVHGCWPKDQLDHINRNPFDNRIDNLRESNNKENCKNQSKPKNNSSGVVGVYWHKHSKKWYAAICIDGKIKSLGYFTNKDDAVTVRKEAERKYGFHENHGVVL